MTILKQHVSGYLAESSGFGFDHGIHGICVFICSIHEVFMYTSWVLSSWNVLEYCSFMNRAISCSRISQELFMNPVHWNVHEKFLKYVPWNVHEPFMNRTISCPRTIHELFMCYSVHELFWHDSWIVHDLFTRVGKGHY